MLYENIVASNLGVVSKMAGNVSAGVQHATAALAKPTAAGIIVAYETSTTEVYGASRGLQLPSS